ncbi:MAG: ImmA/IrrE family metallo-endopeptidase [Blastocatellia bacterium]
MQDSLFRESSPAEAWDQAATRRALDELFSLARQYKSGKDYLELLTFVARFRFYSPFNAMLIHVQMPGATFVAPPHRWLNNYHRRIKAGARPLVILQPMGPVMFVFDVSDTETEDGAPPLPKEVENPFEARKGKINDELTLTIENAKRDGVAVTEREAGSQSAGKIGWAEAGRFLNVLVKQKPAPEHLSAPLRFELLLNSRLSPEAKYATLAHELGHLYCGHLGAPNEKWWPDRQGLNHEMCEFEAESVCYLVCNRLGIDNPSDEYLAGYFRGRVETPSISLDCVMKAAGLIEQMGRARLKPRKEKEG